MRFYYLFLSIGLLFMGCGQTSQSSTENTENTSAAPTHDQSGVQDETSTPDIVKIAVGSKDHTTLVEAVKAADLVNALTNAGPFTVFAPTNAAFEKLPKGTVEGLLKPDQKDALANILQYHVFVGVLNADQLKDGQVINMVNGGNVNITTPNGKPIINGKANIVASIPASNGIIHVIDEVLIPEK